MTLPLHHRWPPGPDSPAPDIPSTHGFLVPPAPDDRRHAERILAFALACGPAPTAYAGTGGGPVLEGITGHLHWRPATNRTIVLAGHPHPEALRGKFFRPAEIRRDPDAIHLGLHLADGRTLSLPTAYLFTRASSEVGRWAPPGHEPGEILVARSRPAGDDERAAEVLAILLTQAYVPPAVNADPRGDAYGRYLAKATEIARGVLMPGAKTARAIALNIQDAVRRGFAATAYGSLPPGTRATVRLHARPVPGPGTHTVVDIDVDDVRIEAG